MGDWADSLVEGRIMSATGCDRRKAMEYLSPRVVEIPPVSETWPSIEHEPEQEPVVPPDMERQQ